MFMHIVTLQNAYNYLAENDYTKLGLLVKSRLKMRLKH